MNHKVNGFPAIGGIARLVAARGADPFAQINRALGSLGQSFAIRMASISAALKAQDARLQRYEPKARLLGQLGWTIPMHMPVVAIPDILEGLEPDVDYDPEFEHFYTVRDGERFTALAAALVADRNITGWHPVLTECVAAYQRGHYQVIVPCLIAVYEGLVAEATASFQSSKDPKGTVAQRRRVSDPGFDRLVWASIEGFTAELYRNAPFSGERPRRANRHWIQHGRDRGGWARTDALRLFQAVHTVSSELSVPAFPRESSGSLGAPDRGV